MYSVYERLRESEALTSCDDTGRNEERAKERENSSTYFQFISVEIFQVLRNIPYKEPAAHSSRETQTTHRHFWQRPINFSSFFKKNLHSFLVLFQVLQMRQSWSKPPTAPDHWSTNTFPIPKNSNVMTATQFRLVQSKSTKSFIQYHSLYLSLWTMINWK